MPLSQPSPDAGREQTTPTAEPSSAGAAGHLVPTATTPPQPGRGGLGALALRRSVPLWAQVVLGILCVAVCLGLWWYVTRGEPDERILSYYTIPSPKETFSKFYPELWVERELTRNTLTTLKRLALGFGLAVVIGVPLGVLCGCFSWINAFFLPLNLFGRNIPVAALIPLTLALFGIGELQKVMFIFIACVAFVVMDTARAIADVGEQYVDTAYTLGASRWQIVLRVLVPLAMPSVFNSLRLLFGLAFGYIMLAEVIKFSGEAGGLGDIINMSQRRSQREPILLVLILIPILALAIDRLLFWVQRELFPHRYGGAGILNQCLRAVMHGWEDFKRWLKWIVRTEPPAVAEAAAPATAINPTAALPQERRSPDEKPVPEKKSS
jgi:NitT/TauT family transport system permease protein